MLPEYFRNCFRIFLELLMVPKLLPEYFKNCFRNASGIASGNFLDLLSLPKLLPELLPVLFSVSKKMEEKSGSDL